MTDTPTALVPLAPGFEETEAVTIIDILRRAEVAVTVAGLEARPIKGSHGITIVPDASLEALTEEDFDAIILPGGMPGSARLRDDATLQTLLRGHADRGRLMAAICAAPIALAAAGLTEGRAATCFPGFEDQLTGADHRTDRVVEDGPLITSRGLGTALEFALALVARLRSPELSAKIAKQVLAAS